MSNKVFSERTTFNSLHEKGFNIPLKTCIEGLDKSGKEFKEKTVLSYISHNGSSFWMNTSISSGSELKLIVDLPPKLGDDKNLKLVIKGKVIFIEAVKGKNSKKRVSVKFDNKYIIEQSK